MSNPLNCVTMFEKVWHACCKVKAELNDTLYFSRSLAGCWTPPVVHCWLRPQDWAGQEKTCWDSRWDQCRSCCKGKIKRKTHHFILKTWFSGYSFPFLLFRPGRTCSWVEWRHWKDAGSGWTAGRWGQCWWSPAATGKCGEDSGLEERSWGQKLQLLFLMSSFASTFQPWATQS